MSITEKLAQFIVETVSDTIDEDARQNARLCLLDWTAVTLAGRSEPLSDILFELFKTLGGTEQASLLGRSCRTSVLNAALINGSVSHALDYDDVSLAMYGHPSVTVAPAVVALAEWKQCSGQAFLDAFILGIEAECRIGRAAGQKICKNGWHATGVLGTFGAAAAAGRLLGLDTGQMVHALGLAGTQAAGLRQAFGTMAKPFHAGKAAMNGLLAALLAEQGFTAPTEMLHGPLGLLDSIAPGCDPGTILDGFGTSWEVNEVQYKFHAACFQTHPAIDAALSINTNLEPERIKSAKIVLHPECPMVANIQEPKTGLEGKFCIPFCLALALIERQTDESWFTDDTVQREDLTALRKKITIVEDATSPSHLGRLTLTLDDGSRIEAAADTLALGKDPETRRTRVKQKFMALVSGILGNDRACNLFARINEIDEIADVSELSELWSCE